MPVPPLLNIPVIPLFDALYASNPLEGGRSTVGTQCMVQYAWGMRTVLPHIHNADTEQGYGLGLIGSAGGLLCEGPRVVRGALHGQFGIE